LPLDVPIAIPGDKMFVFTLGEASSLAASWDDDGADKSEDWERFDKALGFLGVRNTDAELEEWLRRGPSGALGIIDTLEWFVNEHGLNPGDFGLKIARLVQAMEQRIRCVT
jgi:hypothetical protein